MKASRIYIALVLIGLLGGCKKDDTPEIRDAFLHIYGTTGDDLANSLVQGADGSFTFVGEMEISGKEEDAMVIQVDADGELVWKGNFGGAYHDVANDLLVTDAGGFAVAGLYGTNSGDYQAWLLGLSAGGDSSWSVQVTDQGSSEFTSVAQLPGGGYVAVGKAMPGSVENVLVAKISASGSLEWSKTLTDTVATTATSVVVLDADNWFVTGSRQSADSAVQCLTYLLDGNGDPRWSRSWGRGSTGSVYDDYAQVALQLNDTMLAVWGYCKLNEINTDLSFSLVSTGGVLVSDSLYDLGKSEERLMGNDCILSPSGEVVVPAMTFSKGEGSSDILLVGVGSPLTTRKLTMNELYGGSNSDMGIGIVLLNDDAGYGIVGATKSFAYRDDLDAVLLKTYLTGKLYEN